MGTVFTVAAWGPDTARLARAVGRAYDSLRLVDSLLSTYRDDSEISRVNRRVRGGRWAVSPTFAAVLREALAVARVSRGAFDPTLRDWRGVAFDSGAGTVRLARGVKLDFGGIAKGYALDRAALALGGAADSAILSLDGQLVLIGLQSPRSVGIADPERSLDLAAVVDAPAGTSSVSTSSQAEQPGHILDPRTGRPAGRARSVTVLAATATAADAWSTAFFVLGCDSAVAWVDGNRVPGVSVVCVEDAVRWSADLDGRVAVPIDSARPRGRAPGPGPAPGPAGGSRAPRSRS